MSEIKTEGKTPRTDAAVTDHDQDGHHYDHFVVSANFARTLERENAELQEQLDNIKSSTTMAVFDGLMLRLQTALALLEEQQEQLLAWHPSPDSNEFCSGCILATKTAILLSTNALK